ncbi:unnamed protein product [Closterium sp. Naga37s-1]|nr:unnamed protein product [Closterium sp. Naga37s-1]
MRLAEMRAVYAQLAPLMAGMILVAMGLCVALVSMLDVIVSALCPTDQCPEALMLSAGRATIGGIANIIVAPIFGGLSDKHGRKPFLLLGIAGITIPYAILATSSSRLAVYLFFAAETAGSALGGSAWLNLIYAYVADVTAEANRAAAFGAISGTTAFGFLAGPLVARFVPPAITFHVATLLCSCGWVYILCMVPESLPDSLPESPSESLLSQPLLRKAASLADVERGRSLAAADAAVAAVDGVRFPRGVSEGGGGVRSGRRGGVSRESTLAAIAAAVAAVDGEGNSEGGQEGGGGVRSGIGSGGGSGGGSRVSILAAAAAAVAAVDGVGIAGEGQEGGGGVSRGGRGGGGGSGGGVGERTSLLEGCGDGGNGEKGGGRQVGGGGSAGAGRGGARSVKRSKSAVLMRSRSTLKEAAMHIRFSSRLVSMLLLVAFLHAFADNGQVANMLYVFKAKFHWGKNDFSLYTAGIGLFAVLSHLLLLPLLLKMLPLPSLLILAISINTVHVVLYGLAWKPWVVYFALCMSIISALTQTLISTMISHLAGPREQGKLQGVVSSIHSLSAVLAPLTINPITAYFMSDSAPIHQPGAGILVTAIVEAVACVLVLALPPAAGKTGVRALDVSASPTRARAEAQGNVEAASDNH